MANTYTTSDLITNIDIVGHLPDANSFTPQRLVILANRELQLPIMKQILSTRGGYYLTYTDYPIVGDGLYLIPAQAVGGAIVNVELVQSPTIIQVNILEESEQFSTNSPTSTSYGCFMRGNYVQILPTPNLGVARLWHYRRPSQLILTSSAAQVTSIAGTAITVSSVPSSLTVGGMIDGCGSQPPFEILGQATILTIVGTVITLDVPILDLAMGDWLAPEDQTPVPQIPVEFRTLLEQRVVVKVYELQGYLDKLALAKESLKELEASTFSLITPRIKSQTKVIMAVNGGFLSGNPNLITNFPAGRE